MSAMDASMDPGILEKDVMAHHKAVGAVTEANFVMSKGNFKAVNVAVGRMIASALEIETVDVYNAFSAVVPRKFRNA